MYAPTKASSKLLKRLNDGENVFMANSVATPIQGNGKISIKLTSRKLFSLTNDLQVPNMCGNLISRNMIMKACSSIPHEQEVLLCSSIPLEKWFLLCKERK